MHLMPTFLRNARRANEQAADAIADAQERLVDYAKRVTRLEAEVEMAEHRARKRSEQGS